MGLSYSQIYKTKTQKLRGKNLASLRGFKGREGGGEK